MSLGNAESVPSALRSVNRDIDFVSREENNTCFFQEVGAHLHSMHGLAQQPNGLAGRPRHRPEQPPRRLVQPPRRPVQSGHCLVQPRHCLVQSHLSVFWRFFVGADLLSGEQPTPFRRCLGLVRSNLSAACAFLLLVAGSALAGVTNPNISIIGQPNAVLTDDPEDPDRDRVRFDPGEIEIVFDDYLNPYARGFFTLALGEEGMELEEGYFTLFRGLPLEVSLRGGQYRAPFGRLNAIHPHALPFAEPFEVLHAYLPGEEAFIEPGVELTRRLGVGRRIVDSGADRLVPREQLPDRARADGRSRRSSGVGRR